MSIDIAIFTIFLSFNLILGFSAGRRVKTLREFSIGNKTFSTGTITSTIVATWIGGGFMFYALQNIYTNGLQFILALIGGSFCLLLIGQVLAGRMGEFLNNLSIAEAMGDLYGKAARIITAISGTTLAIGSVAIQFKVIGRMITLLLGLEGPWVTIIAACIVIAYSSFGGIRAVTITDIFQFITFTVFVPILALIIWNSLKNPNQVTRILDESPLFSWKQTFTWNVKTLSMLGLILNFMIPGISPAIFQRIAMAKDVEQVRDSFTYASVIDFLITISAAWIAILLLADPTVTNPTNLLNHIITSYAYRGLKGLIAVGIISMSMSTADSFVNATAVLLTNDILKPFKIGIKNSMVTVRSTAIAVGLCSLVLALSMQNLLKLVLLSSSFYMPIVTVPFLLAVFGFRSTTRATIIGMAAGFVTVILWSILFENGDSIIPGMLANPAFLMGSHYLLKEPGGWVGIKDTSSLSSIRQQKISVWKHLFHTIKSANGYAYLQQNLPTAEVAYPLMGIYIVISTYFVFYFFKDNLLAQYPRLQHAIFHSVLLIIFILVTHPIWNESFKKKKSLTTATWYAPILYIFFFLGPLLALIGGLEKEFLFPFIANLVIASIILPFPLFLGMFIIGLPFSWVTFQAITGTDKLPTGFNFWQFKIIYFWILVGSCLGAIFSIRNKYMRVKTKFKQVYLEKLEAELTAKIFAALQDKSEEYETKIKAKQPRSLHQVGQVVTELRSSLEEVYIVELNTLLNEQLAFERLSNMMHELNHALHEMRDRLSLSLSKISPAKLLDQVLEMYRTEIGDYNMYSEVVIKCFTTFKKIQCDIEKIKLLMSNTLQRAQMHNPTKKPLIMRVENTMIVYKIENPSAEVIREEAIKITISTCSRPIQEQDFYIARPNKEVASTIRGSTEPLLLQNLRILDSHYGYMGLELITPTDYQQFYVLPIQVTKLLRSKLLRNNWASA